MKLSETYSRSERAGVPRLNFARGVVAMLVTFIGLAWNPPISRAQQTDDGGPGEQILTRGPVHEAFAGIVSYDPEPGIVVSKAPPEAIEEVPPEERPEGDNIAWIPGYWAWDDERNDFLWISGTWRALPPGREWIAGYWAQTPQGYQWISGYWADATASETTYLPPPPATVEEGPNIAAPSLDDGWTPGCWLWNQGRYAWRPGYWSAGRADWDWTPAHYVWTPRGFVFVDGFWDYTVERRGVLFAPVYFETGFHSRRGYHYSPAIVIDLGVFNDHLFLRPRYNHYYFGDYYAANYQQSGIYASFSFQSSRHGYDPFYSHQRWAHREDREWEHRLAASYQYRREHEDARPPRVWTAGIKIDSRSGTSGQNRLVIAASISQLSQRKDGPVRFQPVARAERQQIVQRGQEVQKSREQRRTLEAVREKPSAKKNGAALEPERVRLPRSPIVAKPADKLERNQIPPKAQRAPKSDPKIQPKAATPPRQPEAGSRTLQPARQPQPDPKVAPQKNAATPPNPLAQSEPAQRAGDSTLKARQQSGQRAQQESEQRAKAEAKRNAEASQQDARQLNKISAEESERRAKASALKAQEQTQREAQDLAKKAQEDSDRRAKAAAAEKTAGEAQQKAREMEMKARQESEQRAKTPATRVQPEVQRNAPVPEQKTQRELVKPDRQGPGPDGKNPAKVLPRDQRKEEKKKSPSPDDPPAP